MKITLEDLGYTKELDSYKHENNLGSFEIARVISEHKERYTVKNEIGEFDAELIGNLRFTAESRSDFPCVGDWVAISVYDDNKALIHTIYPRTSILQRKAIGKSSELQLIASNINVAFIIQSVNRDFKINRLERYLTICHTSNIKPIVIISKIDLISKNELDKLLSDLHKRIENIPVIPLSNISAQGIEVIKSEMKKGQTYCLLGSSGVGKSTLLNNIAGEKLMQTGEISASVNRGKHITTHRELIVTKFGVLIDNPGMREIGITDSKVGIDKTFDEILQLSTQCKYKDCTHTNENHCAVLDALDNEIININSYDNFIKMEKERSFLESNASERKKKDKDLGKLIKNMKKHRNLNKF